MPQALEVVGRESELDSVRDFLDRVGAGACAFLVDGEAGIGKTTLWRAAVTAAAERQQRVLSSRPVEPETALPFAALGDLLEGVGDDVLGGLPGPQRAALEIALLRAELTGQPAGAQGVALAVLGVLRTLAAEGPLLVAIDDVQWLDAPSAEALAFAARRLRDEPVGFLLARRARAGEPFPLGLDAALQHTRVTRLPLGPLELAALDRLFRAHLGHQFMRPTLVELERVSAGNPFFALELARALLERVTPLIAGEGLPLPATLQELLRERLGALPARARELLLVTSVLSRPTVALVTAAAGQGRGRAALERAAAAGIIEVADERIRFTHPLLASVVYTDAPPARRRTLHARLARVVDDPDERAGHLALAATGPDAEVAGALEAAARRARARGAPQVAAELWERAWRLTPPEQAGGWRRAVEAGECHLEAGDTRRAQALIEDVVERLPSGHDRAVALTRLAWVRTFGRGFRDGVDLFRAALAEVGDDSAARIEIERGLAWSVHQLGDVAAAEPHARTALELAEQLGEPALLASALTDTAFFETISGRGIPMELIERALELESDTEWRSILGRVRPAWIQGMLLEWAGDLDAARTTLEALRESTLAHGDEHSLSYIAFHLGRIECLAGNWPLADRYADECLQTSAQTGQDDERPYALTVKALVAAHQGAVAEARAASDEGLPLALEVGVLPAHFELLSIRGFLERSLGDEAAAHHFLGPLPAAAIEAGFGEPALWRYHGEAIENLLALDDVDAATALLAELEEKGQRLGRIWALTIASRCRALFAATGGDIDDAYRHLGRALELHRDLREPFEHARTLLLLGTLRRRDRKKRAARDTLVEALSAFEQLGARLWVEKARGELARIGGRTSATTMLTPTEERIAALIAAGRTYREVADALFISPKTVQWNLSKIYRKLGIRSRTELAATLAATPRPDNGPGDEPARPSRPAGSRTANGH